MSVNTIGVLISGRGSNLQAIIDAVAEGRLDARIGVVISNRTVEAFPNAILNVHPSLLPAFPGVDAQRQALAHGVKVTGATVHLVTPELDAGPIVVQAPVPVLDDDTVETLAARILVEEHRLYPQAIATVLAVGWRIEGRRFVSAS